MATPGRRTDPPLEQVLFEEPYRFDFFQAVRLLSELQPDRVPVGREGPARREVVRFVAQQSLGFPASAIARLTPPADPMDRPTMTVTFLGLTGPSGVLPYIYSELILDRKRNGDTTLVEFLDLLNHRLVSLFFRAWEKHQPILAHDRGEHDRFATYLFDLIGLGSRFLRKRHEFGDEALLWYAGFLARRSRPAMVLEGLLRDFFGLPIEVRQFEGQWLRLDPADRSRIGSSGAHNALGVSLVLGERVWDEQGKFRIRVGPLTFEQFLNFLPDGPAFRPLAQLARLFVHAELDFDVQLVLKAEEVPACQLSSAAMLGRGARLGRHAWLKSREFDRDVVDAVFPALV